MNSMWAILVELDTRDKIEKMERALIKLNTVNNSKRDKYRPNKYR